MATVLTDDEIRSLAVSMETNVEAVTAIAFSLQNTENRVNADAIAAGIARDVTVQRAGEVAGLYSQITSARDAAQDAANTAVAAAAGFVPKGNYSAGVNYANRDLVTFDGSLWRAKANSLDVIPGTDSSKWELFVSKGDPGPAGPVSALAGVIEKTANFTLDENDNGNIYLCNTVGGNIVVTCPTDFGDRGYSFGFRQIGNGEVSFTPVVNRWNHTKMAGEHSTCSVDNFSDEDIWTLSGETTG